MRHNWIDFTDKIFNGLRINPEVGRREMWLQECYNFTVEVGGLSPYLPISKVATGFSESWPFPQIFWNNKIKILATKSQIYTIDDDYVATPVKETSEGGDWELVDYYDYVVLTNGSDIYYRDVDTGVFSRYPPDDDIPLFRTCCNFRGQAFIGNISGWNGMGSGSVAWSKIGEFSFAPDQRNEANFAPVTWNGEVYRLRALGDAVVAYGDKGCMALMPLPSSQHVGSKELPIGGLRSRTAVDGDEHLHILVDEEGFVWKISRDMMPKRVGYREYMLLLDQDKLRVICDSRLRHYYITDGSRCFLLTSYGMSEIFQCPTSVYGREGYIYNENDTHAKVVTSLSDFGYPGIKSISCVDADTEANNLQAIAVNEGYEIFVRANPQGTGYPILAGDRLGVGVRMDDYQSGTITGLKTSFIMQDKNAVRGNINAASS